MSIYSSLPPLFRPAKGAAKGQHSTTPDNVGKVPAQLPLLPEPHHIDAYRAALRQCWSMMAAGPVADPEACPRALNELFKLEDEVGEPRASELRHAWEREWYRETRRCPRCGQPGERHGEGDQ